MCEYHSGLSLASRLQPLFYILNMLTYSMHRAFVLLVLLEMLITQIFAWLFPSYHSGPLTTLVNRSTQPQSHSRHPILFSSLQLTIPEIDLFTCIFSYIVS